MAQKRRKPRARRMSRHNETATMKAEARGSASGSFRQSLEPALCRVVAHAALLYHQHPTFSIGAACAERSHEPSAARSLKTRRPKREGCPNSPALARFITLDGHRRSRLYRGANPITSSSWFKYSGERERLASRIARSAIFGLSLVFFPKSGATFCPGDSVRVPINQF
jgi:hypothetical protein